MRFFPLLILTLLTCLAKTSIAQSKTSNITGTVIDGYTNEPLPFASVSLSQQVKEATNIIGVTQTDNSGGFKFDKLAAGSYKLKVSFVGYRDLEQSIEIQENMSLDVKQLKLLPQSKMLSEVEVTAEKLQIELAPGKRIFNVDKVLLLLVEQPSHCSETYRPLRLMNRELLRYGICRQQYM
jgi:CarboxypepD_reg-like domain